MLTDRLLQWAFEHPALAFYGVTSLWWLGGILTIFVPVAKWQRGRQAYYGLYGRYVEYENAQRNYERAQEQQNEAANYMYDQYGNYDANNGQYDQDGNMNPYAGYSNNCAWWNFSCRKQQNQWRQYQQQYNNNDNNGGSGDRQRIYTPGWYQFLGGKQQGDSRDRQEQMASSQGNSNGGSKFVYAWSMILFVALLLYASAIFYTQYKHTTSRKSGGLLLMPHYVTLLVLLVCLLHFSLLQLVLLPQGVIATDDRDLENSPYGWYGQWGVLLVYWEFAQCLFAGFAALFLGVALVLVRRYNPPKEKGDGLDDAVGGEEEPVSNYGRII